MGVGEPIPAGGASPPSSSLPPAHTKTTHADRGACGRAPRGSGAHTRARPQGPLGFGVTHGGGGEGTEDEQAVPTGAQLRPGGPGRRQSAARTAVGLPGPRGSWPAARVCSLRATAALAAAPLSLVHNLHGSCAPLGPCAASARISRRPSPAHSEPSSSPRAPPAPPRAPRPPPRPRPRPRPRPLARPELHPRPVLTYLGQQQRQGGAVLGPRGVREGPAAAPFGASVRDRRVSRSRPRPGVGISPAWKRPSGPGVVAPGAWRVGAGWVACLVGPLGRGRPLVTVSRRRLLLP